METKELLALDVGEVKTGLARASDLARLAEPLMTVATPKAIETIQQLATEYNISGIVVGLPRNLRGDETAQTDWVRKWAKKAKQQINLPFFWQDEALTSKLAETRKSIPNKTKDVHALSAAIILQDFLDTPQAERVIF